MKHSLSYLFTAGNAKVKEGLKTASYRFAETVLTDMAGKDGLDEVSARSIDWWTRSTSFMDAFTSRALASSQFMRPVAQLIKKRMDDTADDWCWATTAEGTPAAEIKKPWPRPPHLSTYSVEDNRRKHCKNLRKAQAHRVNDLRAKEKLGTRYSTASSDRDTLTLSPGHNSLISDFSGSTGHKVLSQRLVHATDQALPFSNRRTAL